MKKLIFVFGIVVSLVSCNNQMDDTVLYSDLKPVAENEEIHFNIMVRPEYKYDNLTFNVYLESWSGISEAPYDIIIAMRINNSRNSNDLFITGKGDPTDPYTYVYEPLYIKKGEKFDNYAGYYGLTISDLIPISGLEAGDYINIYAFYGDLFDENGLVDLFDISTTQYNIVTSNWYTGEIRWGLYLDGQKYYVK